MSIAIIDRRFQIYQVKLSNSKWENKNDLDNFSNSAIVQFLCAVTIDLIAIR